MEIRLGTKLYCTVWGAVRNKINGKPIWLPKESWRFLQFMSERLGRIVAYEEFVELDGFVRTRSLREQVLEAVARLEGDLGCSVGDHLIEIDEAGLVYEVDERDQVGIVLEKVGELGKAVSALSASSFGME